HPFRHIVLNPNIDFITFNKFLLLTQRGLIYSSKCLRGPSEKYIKNKSIQIKKPKNSTGNILLLDLDETLIHSCGLNENPDAVIMAQEEYNSQKQFQIAFRIRPYCIEFLQQVSKYWDIYVFTASSASYANAIVNYLDSQQEYIHQVLTRQNCMETKNGFFIKDLRIIKDIDLQKAVIVDNLAHSFGLQIDNGIPILEWLNDKNDVELKFLIGYLIEAAQAED
ncbi:NLI interacting factor-like phosphatase family protein, putative, partial [Ichthyophthirius multifiliis]